MRQPLPFDTHAYIKRLMAAGMPEAQAEVQAEALTEFVLSQLATKDDLNQSVERLRTEMKAEFAAVRGEISAVRGEIRESELRVTSKLESELRKQMVWYIGIMMVWTGAMAAVLRLLLQQP